MVDTPKISIITPSYNHGRFLERAILSVCNQNYPNVEHIIIDGGSTDKSLDIIRKYENQLAYWISEPDGGMYQAINKGLDVARGSIIGFLNSDDAYNPGVLKTVIELINKNPCNAIAGRAAYFLDKNNGDRKEYRESNLLTNDIFWFEITYGEPAFNAWFFNKKVFRMLGKFNESYRVVGDRDFLLRFALSDLSYFPYDGILYNYLAHDKSLSMTQNLLEFSKIADENLRLVDKYVGLLPAHAQGHMQRIRTRDTITTVSRNIRGGAWGETLKYVKIGCKHDRYWPLKFLYRILTAPFRMICRVLGFHYFRV